MATGSNDVKSISIPACPGSMEQQGSECSDSLHRRTWQNFETGEQVGNQKNNGKGISSELCHESICSGLVLSGRLKVPVRSADEAKRTTGPEKPLVHPPESFGRPR